MGETVNSPESESVGPVGPAGRIGLLGPRGHNIRLAVSGAALAVLAWLVYVDLFQGVIPYIGKSLTMWAAAVGGAWAGVGRARKWLWWVAIAAVILVVFIGFTPFVPAVMSGIVHSDPLEKAPAVVILAAGVDKRGVMNSNARTRLDRGLELVGMGFAPRIVLTEAAGQTASWAPVVRRHLREIGLNHPIDSVGPVINTHDEALVVTRLAKERGWSHVLLVTHPWHMRRARAAFAKLGLRVVCVPCENMEYDTLSPRMGRARMYAFRDWIHERLALVEYRVKGWVD